MKKVLLTKTQQIRVTTPEIKLRPPNVATTPPAIGAGAGVRVMHMQTNVITSTYIQRKSHQSIYEDIFKLLMRLPDKALQERVIDAINGRSDKLLISSSSKCKQCSSRAEQKPQKVNASTQTECMEPKEETKHTAPSNDIDKKDSVKPEPPPVKKECATTAEPPTGAAATAEPAAKVPRKRGRKRNTCVPQVVKRSTAQMAMQEREDKQLTPLPPNKKKRVEPAVRAANDVAIKSNHSVVSNSSCLSGVNFLDLCNQVDNFINDDNHSQNTIVAIMANEFLRSHQMSDEGLLPIHHAILNGDIYGVQRQVYVWTKLKTDVDINDVVSADGEDCLQLALTNDCEPEIVRIVLNAGMLPNHVYEDSNTALHIAVINNVQLESLRQLMLQIDLKLLLQTNDDGYTALHIAVRHNRYKMAEIICDVIDQRELGAPVYRRTSEDEGRPGQEHSGKNQDLKEEKKFAKFYERACDKLEQNKEKLLGRRLKAEILNASEARAGNAALFYAVEGELEHFCYFLLAHLSDPDEENLSGHSPKSFHYEFARMLRINLKIARIMDKVIGILNGKSS
ncbi:hypothetical protein KR222_010291 [Zaprionus bogoriensis]|nr:hypothetical protein KR222_010291 [Zaprionus bogoriensis]